MRRIRQDCGGWAVSYLISWKQSTNTEKQITWKPSQALNRVSSERSKKLKGGEARRPGMASLGIT
ncbi:hypothetical protein LZ31DRAFT_554831 [Colletotrichum somersetense]|nr:hypothetical protein LZ31DRAFT_554831 [Colletotrichum somersetense]